jgi:hypothetical protein
MLHISSMEDDIHSSFLHSQIPTNIKYMSYSKTCNSLHNIFSLKVFPITQSRFRSVTKSCYKGEDI